MDTKVTVMKFTLGAGTTEADKPHRPKVSVSINHLRVWFGAIRKPAKTVILLVTCVLIGYWFNAFDDAVSGVGRLQPEMWALVYFGGWSGAVTGLALIASALFQVRTRWIPVGAALAMLVFFVTMLLFFLSPLSNTLGYICGNETAWQLAGKRFGMRLFLCWVATFIACSMAWYVRGKRIDWCWVVGCLGVGFGAAMLGGGSLLRARWLYHMKWSKFLSTGLIALLFVLLTGILAEAIQNRLGRKREP